MSVGGKWRDIFCLSQDISESVSDYQLQDYCRQRKVLSSIISKMLRIKKNAFSFSIPFWAVQLFSYHKQQFPKNNEICDSNIRNNPLCQHEIPNLYLKSVRMHLELPKLNIENPKFWVFLQGNPQAMTHFIAQHLDGDLDLEHAEDLEIISIIWNKLSNEQQNILKQISYFKIPMSELDIKYIYANRGFESAYQSIYNWLTPQDTLPNLLRIFIQQNIAKNSKKMFNTNENMLPF